MKICYLFFVWKIYSVFFSLYQQCLVYVIFFLSKTLSLNKSIYACLSNCNMCSLLLIELASAFSSVIWQRFLSVWLNLCVNWVFPIHSKQNYTHHTFCWNFTYLTWLILSFGVQCTLLMLYFFIIFSGAICNSYWSEEWRNAF